MVDMACISRFVCTKSRSGFSTSVSTFNAKSWWESASVSRALTSEFHGMEKTLEQVVS